MSFLVCLKNLDPFMDAKGLYKLVSKLSPGMLPTHLLKQKKKTFGYLKFENGQQKSTFMGLPFTDEHKKLKARQAYVKDYEMRQFVAIADLFKQKNVSFREATQQQMEAVRAIDIRTVVSPYWQTPYEEQITLKAKSIAQAISKLQVEELPEVQFVRAEQTTRYRNKTQFTIGFDSEGQIEVGFNKGSFTNKTVMIDDPANVEMMPEQVIQAASVLKTLFRELYQEDARLGPYNRYEHDTGVWRYLVVRVSQRTKQLSVMVVGCTLHVAPDCLQSAKKRVVERLVAAFQGDYLKGVSFMPHNSKSDSIPYNPPEPIHGSLTYQQIILGCKFEVSPMAFLQGHTPMCEVLYSRIIDQLGSADVVLDLCCGIGTIGICLGKKLTTAKIIGVESVEAACRDAAQNSRFNQVEYEVICGRVEDKLKEVVDRFAGEAKEIVAILDPPRAGLLKQSIQCLRTCKGLDRIIYVACSIEAVVPNLAGLCCMPTKQVKGPPFMIEKVIGLDLFPGTTHFETLIVMRRLV